MGDIIATQPLLKLATISSATISATPKGGHKKTACDFDAAQRRASRPAVLDVPAVVAAADDDEVPPPLPVKERKADNHYIKNKSMQSPTAGKHRVSGRRRPNHIQIG